MTARGPRASGGTAGGRSAPPGPVPAGRARGRPRAARLAVAGLVLWAVGDGFRTTVAVGHYEERITVVTHGGADVPPAWLAYLMLDDLLLRRTEPTSVVGWWWALCLLVAVAAVIAWLYQARREAERLGGTPGWAPWWVVGGWFVPVANLVVPYLVVRDVWRASRAGPAGPVGRWWASVLVTLLLQSAIWWYGGATAASGVLERTALDTRTVAYSLWTLGTVAVVVTAVLTGRVVRRVTMAQQGNGLAPAHTLNYYAS